MYKLCISFVVSMCNISDYNELRLTFQSEYNGNILGNASVIDGEKKTGSPLYSFSKIIERISPDKGSPDKTSYTLRGVC